VRSDAYVKKFLTETDTLFEIYDDDHPKAFNLDNERGQKLVRVLLKLSLSADEELVAGALKLLMRNFSQRQEALDALKQVQLLVSEDHVQVC
jgi:hypothetical protein